MGTSTDSFEWFLVRLSHYMVCSARGNFNREGVKDFGGSMNDGGVNLTTVDAVESKVNN